MALRFPNSTLCALACFGSLFSPKYSGGGRGASAPSALATWRRQPITEGPISRVGSVLPVQQVPGPAVSGVTAVSAVITAARAA